MGIRRQGSGYARYYSAGVFAARFVKSSHDARGDGRKGEMEGGRDLELGHGDNCYIARQDHRNQGLGSHGTPHSPAQPPKGHQTRPTTPPRCSRKLGADSKDPSRVGESFRGGASAHELEARAE